MKTPTGRALMLLGSGSLQWVSAIEALARWGIDRDSADVPTTACIAPFEGFRTIWPISSPLHGNAVEFWLAVRESIAELDALLEKGDIGQVMTFAGQYRNRWRHSYSPRKGVHGSRRGLRLDTWHPVGLEGYPIAGRHFCFCSLLNR